jgi:hypothetical protein
MGADHVFWSMETAPYEQLEAMEQLHAQAP